MPVALAIAGASAAVGGGLPAAAWFVLARRAWAVVLHANLAWPPTALDYVIATPAFHDRHHREDLPAANFSTTLPILDLVCGTYRRARPVVTRAR